MHKPLPCEGCGVFSADRSASVDGCAADLCWLCAHDAEVHGLGGADLRDVHRKYCGCTREEIYPAHVLADRAARAPKLAKVSSAASPPAIGRPARSPTPAQIERDVKRVRGR